MEEVSEWVSATCALPEYAEDFVSCGVDGNMLKDIGADELSALLGIVDEVIRAI